MEETVISPIFSFSISNIKQNNSSVTYMTNITPKFHLFVCRLELGIYIMKTSYNSLP